MDTIVYSILREFIRNGQIHNFKKCFKYPHLIVELINIHDNNTNIKTYECLDYLLDLYKKLMENFYCFLLCVKNTRLYNKDLLYNIKGYYCKNMNLTILYGIPLAKQPKIILKIIKCQGRRDMEVIERVTYSVPGKIIRHKMSLFDFYFAYRSGYCKLLKEKSLLII